MLGYIVPEKPELRIREYEIYSGYYCGICRSIGRRHGQIPRMFLSYDSVFLALILAGLDDAKEDLRIRRCIAHPLKNRPMIENSKAADYAADMYVLMIYHKLKDDYHDEKNLAAFVGAGLMSGKYKRLAARYPDASRRIECELASLTRLEKERTASLDKAAEPYARIMETILKGSAIQGKDPDGHVQDALGKIGFHLGKWVYTIDAFDDIDENIKKNTYNPLLCQFQYDAGSGETADQFRERIVERIEFSLMYCLAELANAFSSLNTKRNKELIENIVYFGLHRKTEEVLRKGRIEKDAESI